MAKRKKKPKIVSTLAEVAKHFGVSYSTVKKEWRVAGMPGVRGRYDLEEIADWKALRERDPDKPPGEETGDRNENKLRKLAAEARIKEAEAEFKERKNLVEEGNIVDRAAVERLFSELFGQMRDQAMRIPLDMKASFPRNCRQDLVEELEERMRMYLEAMHHWGTKL